MEIGGKLASCTKVVLHAIGGWNEHSQLLSICKLVCKHASDEQGAGPRATVLRAVTAAWRFAKQRNTKCGPETTPDHFERCVDSLEAWRLAKAFIETGGAGQELTKGPKREAHMESVDAPDSSSSNSMPASGAERARSRPLAGRPAAQHGKPCRQWSSQQLFLKPRRPGAPHSDVPRMQASQCSMHAPRCGAAPAHSCTAQQNQAGKTDKHI